MPNIPFKQLQELPSLLKNFRDKNKLSQKQVAEYLNISQSTYNYMESGKTTPDIKQLFSLSQLYNINIGDFLGEGNHFFIQENNQNAQMAKTMNLSNTNDKLEKIIEQKDTLLQEYKNFIAQQNEKLSRRDAKIESLKKEIEQLRVHKKEK